MRLAIAFYCARVGNQTDDNNFKMKWLTAYIWLSRFGFKKIKITEDGAIIYIY